MFIRPAAPCFFHIWSRNDLERSDNCLSGPGLQAGRFPEQRGSELSKLLTALNKGPAGLTIERW